MARMLRAAGAAFFAMLLPATFSAEALAQTGSYARTCRGCSVVRGTIACNCQRINGSWARTSLNFTRCPRFSMTNINGSLVCGP